MSETKFEIETAQRPPETPSEVTPTAEVTKEGEDTKVVTEPEPKKSRANQRITTLVGEKKSLSSDNRKLSTELDEAKAELAGLKHKPPQPEDFEEYEDFIKAEDEYVPPKKAEAEKTDTELDEVLDEIEVKFDETREVYEDFDKVVKENGAHITKEMVLSMNDIDNSGEVAYFLGNNVAESLKISKLSKRKQAIAITKLGISLEKKPTIETVGKKSTSAADPINPIGSSGKVAKKQLSDANNFSDYAAMRREQTVDKNGW